ncbi:hypothetical protein L7F22_025861 [Adiantum nelumboides]|nr:hypothetical protein [Adiantum nelumboides]
MSCEPLLPEKVQQGDISAKCSFDFCTEGGNVETQQSGLELKPEIVLVGQRQWRQTWVVQWGRRRVLDPFIVILRRGLEPKLLALSAAIGLTVGVFPVYGVTVGLCALIAVILRSKCHWPTLILANFVVTPFELGLVVPFMRVGERVTNGHHFPFTPRALWDVIRGRASLDVLFGVLHAVIGWSIFAPICCSLLFLIFYPIFGTDKRSLVPNGGPVAVTDVFAFVSIDKEQTLDLVKVLDPLPNWVTEEDLQVYVELYKNSGFEYSMEIPYKCWERNDAKLANREGFTSPVPVLNWRL